ncbi:hypothetical protein HMI55_002086 [Coelomomyces lativittatus]|nr:hypothetical protein HMI55_002086 [Coelomomyces lativittatus]
MNGWTLLFPLCYACLSSFLLAHTSSPFLSLMNHGLTHFEYLHPESIQILLYPSDTPLVLLSFSAYQHDFQFLLTPSHLLHSNASIFTSFKMNQSDLNDSLSDQFYTTSLHDELTIFKGMFLLKKKKKNA